MTESVQTNQDPPHKLAIVGHVHQRDVGEDQHTDNTNKTALAGTRRHNCHDNYASLATSQDAGELG
jgi:hypothetical protein